MGETQNSANRQKDIERILKLRLLDDIFMKEVLKDNLPGVQDIIQVILKRDDIAVVEVRIQDEWPNLAGHSVRLDVTARDADERWYNIEIQRSSEGANEKRARYNVGALDWNLLPAGAEYSDLPEVYVIFITEKDILGGGLPIYTINRVIEETGEPFEDFAHILYVNGAYVGDDNLGKLMADFRERDPKKMHFASLADRAAFYKTTEGGVNSMCQIMEEVRQEARAEGRAEGRKEGRAEGRKEERSQMIQALLRYNTASSLLHDSQFKGLAITQMEIDFAQGRQPS